MKQQFWIFYGSLVAFILSFVIALICCGLNNEFFMNFFIGISGSSLLLVGTSLLTYLAERKRLLNEISLMVHKYGNLFNGNEWFDWQDYYDDDTFKSKEKYN